MSNHEAVFGALSGAAGGVGYVVMYAFWGLAIGLVGWAAWYVLKHNIHVNIYDGKFKETDKGRVKRDKKNGRIKSFELRKYKGDFFGDLKKEFLVPIKKTFGIGYEVNMFRDKDGNLRPIQPPDMADYHTWKGNDSADYKWVGLMMQEAADRYTQETWWDKYGGILMQTAMVSVVAVLIIVVVREQAAMVDAFNQGASNLASTFKTQAQELNTQVINSTR